MTKFWDGENVGHLKSALQRLDVAIVSARSRPDSQPACPLSRNEGHGGAGSHSMARPMRLR